MTAENSQNVFNESGMRDFGLDPANPADRAEWLATTPPEGTPAVSPDTDYSQDTWAYGTAPGPESTNQAHDTELDIPPNIHLGEE